MLAFHSGRGCLDEWGACDLHGNLLGYADSQTISIDANAAGHGWFVDQTPMDNSGFDGFATPECLDLLTTVMHEMGHSIGLGENYDDPLDVMFPWLAEGERRLPDAKNAALIGQAHGGLEI